MRAEARQLAGLVIVVAGLLCAGCGVPRWPAAGPITSPYGLRWNGGPDLHRGVDVAVALGTPIHPMKDGRVRYAGTMAGYGRVVWIDHDRTTLSVYAHLSRVDVSAGERVTRATVLGLSGQSGNATGPVLHFEIWRGGRPVDPVPALGGWPPASRP